MGRVNARASVTGRPVSGPVPTVDVVGAEAEGGFVPVGLVEPVVGDVEGVPPLATAHALRTADAATATSAPLRTLGCLTRITSWPRRGHRLRGAPFALAYRPADDRGNRRHDDQAGDDGARELELLERRVDGWHRAAADLDDEDGGPGPPAD